MVATAAILWAINGVVSKVILASGISSTELAEVRSTGAFVGLAAAVAVTRPRTLRVAVHELPILAVFGIAGLALVQWLYFVAIHRLPVGIALVIQYLAPVLVALWARYAYHERVRRRIWGALALSLAGLALVVEIWRGFELNAVGVAASLGAALAYAFYVLLAERRVRHRDTLSLLCLGFLFASLLWAVVQPWWHFPSHAVAADVSLLGRLGGWHLPVWSLMAWVVVLGTIVPFALPVAALHHIPATRAGIVAELEPVAATVVAFAWLDETLAGVQLVGAAAVIAAIFLAQTART